jgi:benzoylformate decarboxylase
VFDALAARLSPDAVVIEESPSSRPELLARLPARTPLGILSPAMGGLGFGIPAAIGIRMADPGRQVVVLVGDGSSLYSIQALWTAVRYRVGALVIVLANGGYAIMDRLMEMEGASPRWPGFPEIDFVALARAFGCPAEMVVTPDELERTLDDAVASLDGRDEPLVLVVSVAPDETFAA